MGKGSKLDLLNQLTRVEQERDELLQAIAILVFRETDNSEAHLHPIDLARVWEIEVQPTPEGGIHLTSRLAPEVKPVEP